jgi:hypothetical protein
MDTSTQTTSVSSVNILVVLAAIAVASFIGLQLQQYLNIVCIMRGECYGRTDWVYLLTLIPIPLIMLTLGAAFLLIFSLITPRTVLFLQAKGGLNDVAQDALRQSSHRLAQASGLMLVLTASAAYWCTTF